MFTEMRLKYLLLFIFFTFFLPKPTLAKKTIECEIKERVECLDCSARHLVECDDKYQLRGFLDCNTVRGIRGDRDGASGNTYFLENIPRDDRCNDMNRLRAWVQRKVKRGKIPGTGQFPHSFKFVVDESTKIYQSPEAQVLAGEINRSRNWEKEACIALQPAILISNLAERERVAQQRSCPLPDKICSRSVICDTSNFGSVALKVECPSKGDRCPGPTACAIAKLKEVVVTADAGKIESNYSEEGQQGTVTR